MMYGNEVNQIKGILYNGLRRYVFNVGNTRKDDGVDKLIIHASSAYFTCPRFVFYVRHRKVRPDMSKGVELPNSFAVTFGIGLSIEKMVITSFRRIGSTEIFGRLLCTNCGYETIANISRATLTCPNCGAKLRKRQVNLTYKIADDLLIVGNVDLIMYNSAISEYSHIYEIKSMNKRDFENLKFPLLNHQSQVKTYLWLASKNRKMLKDTKLNNKYGFIIYVCKEHTKDPIKVFKVTKDMDFVREMNRFVHILKVDKLGSRICPDKNSIVARNCPAREVCFNIKSKKRR